uniref:Uncharacterized protein n=1 Tax=Pristionchus pacificus TaxID=54126 RepID=A0A2A6CSI2_PRIPA|eukprot:PDM81099.1 hypothetical protein PRIPAC_36102 [Pristionchus pacificus]
MEDERGRNGGTRDETCLPAGDQLVGITKQDITGFKSEIDQIKIHVFLGSSRMFISAFSLFAVGLMSTLAFPVDILLQFLM